MVDPDLEAINQEILSILREKFDLHPKAWSLGMTLPADQFEKIPTDHPHRVLADSLQLTYSSPDRQIQWAVTIQREIRIEDFPPHLKLTPPE